MKFLIITYWRVIYSFIYCVHTYCVCCGSPTDVDGIPMPNTKVQTEQINWAICVS